MREMLEEHSSEAVVPAAVPKTPSAADGVSETKKIQAIEYFKKKKRQNKLYVSFNYTMNFSLSEIGASFPM